MMNPQCPKTGSLLPHLYFHTNTGLGIEIKPIILAAHPVISIYAADAGLGIRSYTIIFATGQIKQSKNIHRCRHPYIGIVQACPAQTALDFKSQPFGGVAG